MARQNNSTFRGYSFLQEQPVELCTPGDGFCLADNGIGGRDEDVLSPFKDIDLLSDVNKQLCHDPSQSSILTEHHPSLKAPVNFL